MEHTARFLVNSPLTLEKEVGIVRWITQHPLETAITFAEFILKYASQIDPTVGDDIYTAVIKPSNGIEIRANSFSPGTEYSQSHPTNTSPLPSGLSVIDPNSEGPSSRGH